MTMKKILYLLCSCFAVTLMASCEDFLDKTPQGDKTDQDIFSRFNETESLINRLYFYARAARPAARAHPFLQRLGAHGRMRRLFGRERMDPTSSTTATGNRVPSSTPRATPRPMRVPATPSGPNSTKTSAAPTSSSKVSRSTTPRIPRHAPARSRSVSARCSSSAPTCTTAC